MQWKSRRHWSPSELIRQRALAERRRARPPRGGYRAGTKALPRRHVAAVGRARRFGLSAAHLKFLRHKRQIRSGTSNGKAALKSISLLVP